MFVYDVFDLVWLRPTICNWYALADEGNKVFIMEQICYLR